MAIQIYNLGALGAIAVLASHQANQKFMLIFREGGPEPSMRDANTTSPSAANPAHD